MANKLINELGELITAVATDLFLVEDADNQTVALKISGTNLRLFMRGGLTANRAVETNASGVIISSTITSTELGYLNGVTSSIQTQINTNTAAHHTRSHAMTGASDHSASTWKLFHSDNTGVVELAFSASAGDVLTSGGLSSAPTWTTPHSRLHTMTSTADHQAVGTWKMMYSDASVDIKEFAVGAANTVLKGNTTSSAPSFGTVSPTAIVSGTVSRAAYFNGSGVLTPHSQITEIELAYLNGVTSSIQTQLNGKASTSHTHTHVSTTGRTVNDHHDETHTLGSHSNVNVNVDTLGLPDNGEQLTWNNAASEWVSDIA